MSDRRVPALLLLAVATPIAIWATRAGAAGNVTEVLALSVPIWCAAISVALAATGGLYNLGAEGQLLAGAVGASAVAAALESAGLGGPLGLAVCLVAAGFAGGLLGLAAGAARSRLGMDEAVTSLMLNFLAAAAARYAAAGPLRDPTSFGYPWTVPIPADLRLGTVGLPGIPAVPQGLLVASAAALAAWALTFRTRLGLETRAIGSNPTAATALGIDCDRRVIQVMSASGLLAGLGGGLELLGHQYRLGPFFSPGLGFTGLVAAVLAQSVGPLLGILALALAAIRSGLQTAERLAGVPASVSFMIQGAFLLIASLAGRSGNKTFTLRPRRSQPGRHDPATGRRLGHRKRLPSEDLLE